MLLPVGIESGPLLASDSKSNTLLSTLTWPFACKTETLVRVSDANIGIIANFVYLVKTQMSLQLCVILFTGGLPRGESAQGGLHQGGVCPGEGLHPGGLPREGGLHPGRSAWGGGSYVEYNFSASGSVFYIGW